MRVSRIRDFLQSLGSLTASATFVFVEWHCAIYNIAAMKPISRAGHEVRGMRHERKTFLMPHASCLMPHASCLMPHASCLMPHASCHYRVNGALFSCEFSSAPNNSPSRKYTPATPPSVVR